MLRLSAACLLAVLAACGGSAPPAMVDVATRDPAAPLTVRAAATCSVSAAPGVDVSQAAILLDGQPLASGASAQLPAALTGRHVLRFQLPGCESKDVVIVIDPQAAPRIEVTLQPAMAADEGSPFVYDLYRGRPGSRDDHGVARGQRDGRSRRCQPPGRGSRRYTTMSRSAQRSAGSLRKDMSRSMRPAQRASSSCSSQGSRPRFCESTSR